MYYGEERLVMTILLIYLVVFGILLIKAVTSYVLQGIGMYTLGKRRGMDNPWLAFIPYARVYYQGELCGTLRFRERKIKNPGIWLLVVPIVANVIAGILIGVFWAGTAVKMAGIAQTLQYYGDPYYAVQDLFSGFGSGLLLAVIFGVCLLSVVAAAARSVLLVLVNHQIYERYTDRNYALLHAVAGIFLPLYTSVYFFVIRNREEIAAEQIQE